LWVAGGRGWKLTIKMITFDYIENMHVMLRAAANRDGGGVEGENAPYWWLTLIP
jgi:hypothetical protein